jgi:LSD1 subclass zinc finger protein
MNALGISKWLTRAFFRGQRMPKQLNCSTCAAPLDPETGALKTKCSYCGNTLVLPEELRGATGHRAGSLGSAIDQGLKLAEIARLLNAGNKIEAIKVYRAAFGGGLKEAKDAVERMERGEPITVLHASAESRDPGMHSRLPFHITHDRSAGLKKNRVVFWIAGVVIAIVAITGLAIVLGGLAAFQAVQQTTAAVPAAPATATPKPAAPVAMPGRAPAPPESSFANVALEFGSEGIGAGQFKDARAVAVDGEGRIYVGEYSGGRVQVFDPQGKFITQWMVDQERVLLNLAADRKGIVYVVHSNSFLRYEGATGRLLGEVPRLSGKRYENYSDGFVALDGSIYAIGSGDNILRISPDGQVRTVVDTRERVGERVSFDKLAVDGTGNIYVLDRNTSMVFRFAPDGRFINRFGGRGEQPGQIFSPHNIAIDGQGRVYVSDTFRSVHVFDGGGRYIDSFGGREVTFGLAINDQNEVFACLRNRHKIVKYVLKKP